MTSIFICVNDLRYRSTLFKIDSDYSTFEIFPCQDPRINFLIIISLNNSASISFCYNPMDGSKILPLGIKNNYIPNFKIFKIKSFINMNYISPANCGEHGSFVWTYEFVGAGGKKEEGNE